MVSKLVILNGETHFFCVKSLNLGVISLVSEA